MVARNTRTERRKRNKISQKKRRKISRLYNTTARVPKIFENKNKTMEINMPNGTRMSVHKAKKLGLKYLEKASKFLDFLTKNAESFTKKKYDRHAMIATAIQNHLRDKNTLREIGRNVDVNEENPFTFIDDLYNDIQELFEEYHEEDNYETKMILQEQMILLTGHINDAVGKAKAGFAEEKERSRMRRNETMNSVRSASLSRDDDKDVDELVAMFKGL